MSADRSRRALLVALDPADGSERWRTEIRDPWDPYLFAGDGTVYVSTGQRGRISWELAPDTGELTRKEPEPGADFPAERFFLDGAVYAVDPFFGVVHGEGWSKSVDAGGPFVVSGGENHVFYLAEEGKEPGLHAVSRSDGSVTWSTDVVTTAETPPVVARDCLLVRGEESVYCLDPTDGTEHWSRPVEEFGERFAVADDLVFAAGGGAVSAFQSV
jgi:outer membrane protein assembly factor BamB